MAKISQFVLWAQWALLPLSSGTQSERRWGTAAQSGLCFGVSSGCPVTMGHRDVCYAKVVRASSFLLPLHQTWGRKSINDAFIHLFKVVIQLTSKSTFSPSGILGADGLVIRKVNIEMPGVSDKNQKTNEALTWTLAFLLFSASTKRHKE